MLKRLIRTNIQYEKKERKIKIKQKPTMGKLFFNN